MRTIVRRVGLWLTAALALPLVLVSSVGAITAPPPEALLVGDSVMAGMAQSYGATSRAQLAARHSYILDAKGCRRLITTSCSIGGNPPPTYALQVIKALSGRYREALVVAAGYNDTTTGSVGLTTAVDVILAEAKRQHVPYVIWLTYREAGPSRSRFHAHNIVLRSKAAQYPQLFIADWATRSASMPSSWFSADGIHLGTDATIAMADLIGDTIDLVEKPIGTSHCVVTASTIALSNPTPSPTTIAAVDVAAAALPARRLNLWCP